ncbi:MAG: hypothetical protein KatS3mg111_1372 [Pirellulaceae bacterium]|nr:MAG: hypothetical protein KatS3mg111_1372 [Pirellulaceae bacterium]
MDDFEVVELNRQQQPANTVGRRLVIGTAIAIAVGVLGLLALVQWHVQSERLREEIVASWRPVAALLDLRYRMIEREVAAAVDAEELPIAWAERFRLAIDRFRTTVDAARQIEAAAMVEQVLSEQRQYAAPPSDELLSAVDALNEAIGDYLKWRTSVPARLLRVFVTLPDVPEFALAQS